MRRFPLLLIVFCLMVFPAFGQSIHNGPHDPDAARSDMSNVTLPMVVDGENMATEDFALNAAGGTLIYYSTTTASDIGGFNALTSTEFFPETSTVVSGVTTTKAVFGQQITPDGEPGLTFMPAGYAVVHFTAESSTKDVYVTPTMWVRKADTSVIQLATATTPITVTTVKAAHDATLEVSEDVQLDATDRIFMRLYMQASAAPAQDVTIYFGGENSTHIHFPVSTDIFARTDGKNTSLEYINFNTALGANPAYQAGRMYYDYLEGVLAFMPIINGPILQIGQENWIWAYNNTGSTITNGQAVYIDSALAGTVPLAKLAQADAVSTSDVIAVCTNDVANAAYGFFTTQGKCNSLDTSGFSAGDLLYLDSATAGTLVNSIPATGYVVQVGRVVTSDAANGSVYVKPVTCGSLCEARFADAVRAPYLDITGNIYASGTAQIMGETLIATSTDAGSFDLQVGGRVYASGLNSHILKVDTLGDVLTLRYSGGTDIRLESRADYAGIYAYKLSDTSFKPLVLGYSASGGNVLIGTATDDATNKLQVAGSVMKSSGLTEKWLSTGESGSVANAGTLSVSDYTVGQEDSGTIYVCDRTGLGFAKFFFYGTTTVEEQDSNGAFTITKDTASKINIYIDSGAIVLQNNIGASRFFKIHVEGFDY